jgi:hypothetical protein
MSKDIIVSKLCQELGQEFVSERQVVYVLAETRKILEVTPSEEKYPSLRFFCDWVLHTTMSRKSAQVVLRNFDEAHAKCRAKAPPMWGAGRWLSQSIEIS